MFVHGARAAPRASRVLSVLRPTLARRTTILNPSRSFFSLFPSSKEVVTLASVLENSEAAPSSEETQTAVEAVGEALQSVDPVRTLTFFERRILGGLTPEQYEPSFIVDSFQQTLSALHELTGLSWAGSIIALACLARIATIPFTIASHRNAVVSAWGATEIGEVRSELQKAAQIDSKNLGPEARRRYSAVMKKYGVNMGKMFLPFLQIPLFMTFFFGLRTLSFTFPCILQESFLWLPSLGEVDPLFILPVASATAFYLAAVTSTWLNPPVAGAPAFAVMMTKYARYLPFIFVPFTMLFPGQMLVYWVAQGLSTSAVNLFMISPFVRHKFNIPLPISKYPHLEGRRLLPSDFPDEVHSMIFAHLHKAPPVLTDEAKQTQFEAAQRSLKEDIKEEATTETKAEPGSTTRKTKRSVKQVMIRKRNKRKRRSKKK